MGLRMADLFDAVLPRYSVCIALLHINLDALSSFAAFISDLYYRCCLRTSRLMNHVPAIFFEGVFYDFLKGTLLPACDLSGRFGKIAAGTYTKGHKHRGLLHNGRLHTETYYNRDDRPFDGENASRKHLIHTTVIIYADQQRHSADSAALEKVSVAVKRRPIVIALRSSDISKEMSKFVESIQFIVDLQILREVTSAVLKMMESVVRKNTLNSIFMIFQANIVIEPQTTQLLVDLLKQRQCHTVFLPENCATAITAILASWWENADEMVGKIVYCRERLVDFELLTQFEECTEDEERDAQRAYPFAGYWTKITTKYVLKGPLDRAVYWLSRKTKFKTLFVFA